MKNHVILNPLVLASLSLVFPLLPSASGAVTVYTHTDSVTVNSSTTTTTDPVTDNPGIGGDFVIRERRIQTQNDRRLSVFLQYDVSAITVAEANAPGFTAEFRVDYVGQLNDANSAAATVGQNVSGSWDSSGSNNPLQAWGFEAGSGVNATNTQNLLADIAAATSPVNDITVDVTAIVQDWVNTPSNNLGLVLFIPELEAQAAGFSNPELVVTTIPEPSAVMLLALGLCPILRRRR